MIVDGKSIARDILARVQSSVVDLGRAPKLGIVLMDPDFATEKFVAIKKKRARELGIKIIEMVLPKDASTEDALASVSLLSSQVDGVIVQLPLGKHVNVQAVLAAIPPGLDVDGITKESQVLSPVVGACKEILERSSVGLNNTRVVVVGRGRLVGIPAAEWFEKEGAEVISVDEGDAVADVTKTADIIVLGAGHPGLLTPEMVKEGVVILDAGTSESSGKLAGDADPLCAEKASIFTPVPGGVGPVAVSMIFKNLLTLIEKKTARA